MVGWAEDALLTGLFRFSVGSNHELEEEHLQPVQPHVRHQRLGPRKRFSCNAAADLLPMLAISANGEDGRRPLVTPPT